MSLIQNLIMNQISFLIILKHKKVLLETELSQVKKELMEEIAQL